MCPTEITPLFNLVQYACQLTETCVIKFQVEIEKFTGYGSAVMNSDEENILFSF